MNSTNHFLPENVFPFICSLCPFCISSLPSAFIMGLLTSKYCFCLSENVFTSTYICEGNFHMVWKSRLAVFVCFIFVYPLKIPFHCLLASVTLRNQSKYCTFKGFFFFFFLAAFKTFSLFLVFCSFMMMFLGVDFFLFTLNETERNSWFCGLMFSSVLENLSYYFFKYCFCPILFLLSSWNTS